MTLRGTLSNTRRVNLALISLCAAISIIPLLYPQIPPLSDVLGHIGRYHVQLNLAHDADLQRFYGFHWSFIGNLGVDLLVQIFGPIFGIEPAVKLIVIAIIGLTSASFMAVSREAHGRIGAAALFALPLAYGFPFQFGFINYCLSMACAFAGFALWLRLAKLQRLGLRAIIFAPGAVMLWVVHVSGWGAFGLFAFAAEVVRHRESGRTWFETLRGAVIGCLPLAIPAVIMVVAALTGGATGEGGGTGGWFQWNIKRQWFMMALSQESKAFDIFSVMLLLFIVAASAILSKIRFNKTLGLAALLLFTAYILTPLILLSSAYADMRLAPFVLAMALLAVDTRQPGNARFRTVIMAAGMIFFLVRTAATTDYYRRYDALLQSEFAAIDHMPRGARVASFITNGCNPEWALNRRTHVPSIALARRSIFTNDQFIMPGAQLIQIRYVDGFPFDRDPTQLIKPAGCIRDDLLTLPQSIAKLPRDSFDFVWLIARAGDPPFNFAGFDKVWQGGEHNRSALYRIKHSPER